uniref:Uncharacterized protein n=1 Tax=Arundo donax TaxID=35708 RepID=A0A0A9CKZ3_ARUDO
MAWQRHSMARRLRSQSGRPASLTPRRASREMPKWKRLQVGDGALPVLQVGPIQRDRAGLGKQSGVVENLDLDWAVMVEDRCYYVGIRWRDATDKKMVTLDFDLCCSRKKMEVLQLVLA